MVKLIFAKTCGISYNRSNLGYWLHAITEFRLKWELRGELNSKMGVTVLAIDFTTRIRMMEIINCWFSICRETGLG